MRRAIARTRKFWVAAEGDGFTALVATVGIAAIVRTELDQRGQPRLDADAAECDRSDIPDCGGRCDRISGMAPGRFRYKRAFRPFWPPDGRQSPRPLRWAFRTWETHAHAATKRGIARIGCIEFRIEAARDLPVAQAALAVFSERLAMLRRPNEGLHGWPFRDARTARGAVFVRRTLYFRYSEQKVKLDLR